MLKNSLHTDLLEAGTDEAGRGPLAGPVYAAAVILPPDFYHPLLNDSKQMKEKERYMLREIICKEAVAWAVEAVSAQRIDKINILRASCEAMSNAIKALSPQPEYVLVDGNRFYSSIQIPFQCIVKGDATYANIAAASVLAKTFRDDYMIELSAKYPMYNWDKNKGYPTKAHYEAIKKYGLSPFHRKSFHIEDTQLSLFSEL
ncbi:MAG: ribonuclease HII [Alistipes sp.]|nr:ribonuclease HII [Candidatus Alistipes equi]